MPETFERELNTTCVSHLLLVTPPDSLLLSSNDLTGSVPLEICDLGLANLKVLSVDVEVNCDCTEFANACHPVGST